MHSKLPSAALQLVLEILSYHNLKVVYMDAYLLTMGPLPCCIKFITSSPA